MEFLANQLGTGATALINDKMVGSFYVVSPLKPAIDVFRVLISGSGASKFRFFLVLKSGDF
jgi:hypothetical protein